MTTAAEDAQLAVHRAGEVAVRLVPCACASPPARWQDRRRYWWHHDAKCPARTAGEAAAHEAWRQHR